MPANPVTTALINVNLADNQVGAITEADLREVAHALAEDAGEVGASAFGDLTDAATVNLPTVNTPLGTALGTKQATLVSGTNIKTINSTSLLGAGDIVISGGGATGPYVEVIADEWLEDKSFINATGNTSLTYTGASVDALLRFKQDVAGSRTLDIDGTSITVNPAASSVTYVTRQEVDGEVDYTWETNVVSAAGLTQLATPTLAMTVNSDTAITFDYTNVANESSYVVQIATNAGFTTGVQTATPAANDTSHQFTGLTASTLYYGRVKAVGDGITYSDSAYGTDSDTTQAAGLTPLSAPTLTMSVISDTEIDFDWTNVANESSFYAQIAEDASFTVGVQTATPAADDLSHSFTGLTASTLYYGRVKAVGDGVTYSDSTYGTDSDTTSAGGGAVAVTWRDLDDMATANDGVYRNAGTGAAIDASAMTVEDFPIGTSLEFEPINVIGDMYLGFDDNPGAFAAIDSGLRLLTDATNINIEKWVAGSSGGFFPTTTTVPGASKFKLTRNAGDVEVFIQNPTTGPVWTSLGTLPSITGTQYFGLILNSLNSGIIDALKS